MSEESKGFDAYEVVLADLRAKRAQLDQTIAALEASRSGSPISTPIEQGAAANPAASEGPGAFLGMTIPEAAKKLLANRRAPMRNPEIAQAFKAGGLHMNSADPVNTIGSVLTRRAEVVGDIVKIGRGTWGLKEWYPNRSFKKGKATEEKPESGPKD